MLMCIMLCLFPWGVAPGRRRDLSAIWAGMRAQPALPLSVPLGSGTLTGQFFRLISVTQPSIEPGVLQTAALPERQHPGLIIFLASY